MTTRPTWRGDKFSTGVASLGARLLPALPHPHSRFFVESLSSPKFRFRVNHP